jgi:hypothetical protein
MRPIHLYAFAALALPAPALAAPEAPALIANGDGTVTLTAAIDSDPPVLPRAARPTRTAGHARARAEAERDFDRAFQEATDQAREAARLPPPR